MSTLSAETIARLSELNRSQPTRSSSDPAHVIAPFSLDENVTTESANCDSTPTCLEAVSEDPKTATSPSASRSIESSGESTRDLPAGREVVSACGSYWRMDASLEKLWRGGPGHVRRGADFLRVAIQSQENPHAEFAALAQSFPEKTMFLDLETCGFAGSIIFLVGLLHFEDGELKLSQLLARNYAEEKAMLHGLWQLAAKASVLATFNGKSFDWPCVHDRSTLHHLGKDDRNLSATATPPADREIFNGDLDEPLNAKCARPRLVHCDLLHHSRRKWKDKLPNCRLQTLERYVCGRRRYDDIPGSAIPAAYHQFVRTGDAWEMRSVLHHNALDLITLLQLCMKVVE